MPELGSESLGCHKPCYPPSFDVLHGTEDSLLLLVLSWVLSLVLKAALGLQHLLLKQAVGQRKAHLGLHLQVQQDVHGKHRGPRLHSPRH